MKFLRMRLRSYHYLLLLSLSQLSYGRDTSPEAPSAAAATPPATTTAPVTSTASKTEAAVAAEVDPPCAPSLDPVPDISRSETYKGQPFQPGEEARYTLKYGLLRVHVGYGFLRVQPPTKYSVATGKKNGQTIEENRWHRVFAAEAYTGDWYKMIFAGHDKLQAFSRPWDYGVTKFYIAQDEEKPFVRRFHAEKWLDFNHVDCQVHERMVDHKKQKEKEEQHFLQPAAVDALGALYRLRTFKFEPDKTERMLVYTSEKNWWLEATPLVIETIETPLGPLKAQKLGVKTYLGKELQQRGTLFVWIATEHPNRPMVKVEGEVTFGSIHLLLDQFTPGKAL